MRGRDFYLVFEELQKAKGLKIAEIARICGLPDTTVRGIIPRKQKDVSLSVAFALSEGLGVSLEYLNGMEPLNAERKPQITLSQSERDLMELYRHADPGTQSGIMMILESQCDSKKEVISVS